MGIVTNDGRYGSSGPNAGLAGLPQINCHWKHTASSGSDSQFNLTGGYTGFKNLTLAVAINNLTDQNPPLIADNLYTGYLTSVADIQGRRFKVSAEYKCSGE